MSTRYFGLFAGVLFSAAASAEVYRWVDAQGQVHYGDQPPADAPFETIPPPLSPAADGAQQALRDYVRTLEVQDAERATEAEQKRRQEEREADRRAECESSRQRRARLENPRRLEYQADGTARRLTEEERQARILEMEKRLADACSNES